jgi:para-aminobenzoate synthetase component I
MKMQNISSKIQSLYDTHAPKGIQFNPFEIFRTIAKSQEEGFFLDNWNNQGITVFGFKPKKSISGLVGANANESGDFLKTLKAFQDCLNNELKSPIQFDFEGGLIALCGYELRREFENIRQSKVRTSQFPDWYLGDFRDVVIYEHSSQSYWSDQDALNWFEGLSVELKESSSKWSEMNPTVEGSDYESWVKQTKEYILAGDIFQANLAQAFKIEYSGGDALSLYSKIRELNPSPYACVVFNKKENWKVLSNSPELLFDIRNSKITTKPIAGTRKRGKTDLEDAKLKKDLFSSEKEMAEHLMLVDLERNDLGRVAKTGSVVVKEFGACENYKHVMHIVSTVVADLRSELCVTDVLKALFPGGTITGAPKIRSMEIIDELELKPRGFYTGSLGWIGPGGNCEFNILIRTLQLFGGDTDGEAWLHVGAGLVADSDPKMEYKETLHKAESWKSVLESEK